MNDRHPDGASGAEPSTLTDEELSEMGVDPSARSSLEGVLALGAWIARGWKWCRSDWRNGALAVAVPALFVLGLVALGSNNAPATPPPSTPVITEVPVAPKTHKFAWGESWKSVAAANGVTWQALVHANIDIVRENTAWCNARPTSSNYRGGLLEDGKGKRNGTFCQIFILDEFGREPLAVETVKVGQIATVPPSEATLASTNP